MPARWDMNAVARVLFAVVTIVTAAFGVRARAHASEQAHAYASGQASTGEAVASAADLPSPSASADGGAFARARAGAMARAREAAAKAGNIPTIDGAAAASNPGDLPALAGALSRARAAAPAGGAPASAPAQDTAAGGNAADIPAPARTGAPATGAEQGANPQAAGHENAGRPLQLEVFVNGTSTQLIGSFVTVDGTRLAAKRSELKGIGIKAEAGKDDDLVILNELSGLAYRYDEPRQRVDMEVADQRRVAHEVDGRGTVEAIDKPVSGYGAALNYLVFGTSTQEKDTNGFQFAGASAQLDARFFTPFGYLQQGYVVGKTVNANMEALRLDTTFVHSDVANATTYRYGDYISGSMGWSRAVRLGGFQIERNFGIRSDLVTAAMPSFSGSAAVPSTIDVFVNNVRTMSKEVPAGPYQVSNIPGMTGSGDARIVVRDASGREVTTNQSFYASSRLLAEGMFDYSFQAGVPRFDYASKSLSYAPWPIAIGSLRYGYNSNLTLEGYGEWGAGTANVGFGFATTYGGIGTFSFAGRASQYGGATGALLYGAFETQLWGMSLTATSQRTFGQFEDVASVTARASSSAFNWNNVSLDVLRLDPFATSMVDNVTTSTTNTRVARAMDRVSVGIPIIKGKSSLGLSFLNVEQASGDVSRIFTANYSHMLSDKAALSVNAFSDTGSSRSMGVYASVSFPIGGGAQASVGTSSTKSGTAATVDLSKPLSQQVGDYGWRARRSDGGDGSGMGGAVSYRTGIGRVELSGEQYSGGSRVTAEVEGSIALTRSGLQLGNRINDSFAVVDVGAPQVPVYHENRLVGITGPSGKLLVPNLVPYQKNKISIDTDKLPVGARVEKTQEFIVPADQSGVDVSFGVNASTRAVIVVLHDASGKPLAAGLKGKIEGGSERMAVGYDGRIFVNDVKETNTMIVDLLDKECRVTFDFKGAGDGQEVIGPFVCQ